MRTFVNINVGFSFSLRPSYRSYGAHHHATREVSVARVHYFVVATMDGVDPAAFAVCDLHVVGSRVNPINEAPHRTGMWEGRVGSQDGFTHRNFPVEFPYLDEKLCYMEIPQDFDCDDSIRTGLPITFAGSTRWCEYHTMTLHY